MNTFLLVLLGYLFAGTLSYWILHRIVLKLYPPENHSHNDGMFVFIVITWPAATPFFLAVFAKEAEDFSVAEKVTEFYNNIFNP